MREALGANPDKSRVAKALRNISRRCHPDKTDDVRLHEAMVVLRKYVDTCGEAYLLLCWRQLSSPSPPPAPPPPPPSSSSPSHMSASDAKAFEQVVSLHRKTALYDKNARDTVRCLVQILTGTHKHEAMLQDILPCRGDRDFVSFLPQRRRGAAGGGGARASPPPAVQSRRPAAQARARCTSSACPAGTSRRRCSSCTTWECACLPRLYGSGRSAPRAATKPAAQGPVAVSRRAVLGLQGKANHGGKDCSLAASRTLIA